MPDVPPPANFAQETLPVIPPPTGATWFRVYDSRFSDPLGTGLRESRFSDGTFPVLYLASDRETTIAETLIRDRRTGSPYPVVISQSELIAVDVGIITLSRELKLLDFQDGKLIGTSVDTDLVQRREFMPGWARALYDHPAAFDGALYPSRLTGNLNVALYDRGIAQASLVRKTQLLHWPDIEDILDAHNVAIDDESEPADDPKA